MGIAPPFRLQHLGSQIRDARHWTMGWRPGANLQVGVALLGNYAV